MSLVSFLLVWLVFRAPTSRACPFPPATWCDDERVAAACGAAASCAAHKTETRGRRLQVTLLYETLCPDCQRFVAEQLKPPLWKVARGFVDFRFLPYGNARRLAPGAGGAVPIQCQHGEMECYLNKLHSCAIKYLTYDQNRWFQFIYCMEEQASRKVAPEPATQLCFDATRIKPSERKAIAQCRDGSEGDDLQAGAARLTGAVWPQNHTFVPWIVVNGVSTAGVQIYQQNFVQFLCAWYNGDSEPAGCSDLSLNAEDAKCSAQKV